MRFPAVDPQQSFPELEERVLARWRERDVFAESIRRRDLTREPSMRGRARSERLRARGERAGAGAKRAPT